MKKITILLALVVISCGTPLKSISPDYISENKPELNNATTSEIGVTLVSKEQGRIYEAIQITNGANIRPNGIKKEIKEGSVFINDNETKDFKIFSNLSDHSYAIAISKIDGHNAIYSNGNMYKMPQIAFKRIKHPIKDSEYFRQEFIYNGKIGSAIKFIYREFTDNYARPGFTQELQYDLSESPIIGFKGLRIEITEATNTLIKYKVISHFN